MQFNWRRGGAFGERAELPSLPKDILDDPVWVVLVKDRGAIEQRGLASFWKPGGKWWRECRYWCYADELLATLPEAKQP